MWTDMEAWAGDCVIQRLKMKTSEVMQVGDEVEMMKTGNYGNEKKMDKS